MRVYISLTKPFSKSIPSNLKCGYSFGLKALIWMDTEFSFCSHKERNSLKIALFNKDIFMEFSRQHGSKVSLISNTSIEHTSIHHHIMFNDEFRTVTSISNDETPPSFGIEVGIDENVYTIPLDDEPGVILGDKCYTSRKREERAQSS